MPLVYQKFSKINHNYYALPNANTGTSTLPPFYNVSNIFYINFCYLYNRVSLTVLAYVLYVTNQSIGIC